ncbi:hypothetical protein ACFLYS_02120 [Chloroflexota bacterium]
MAPLQKRALYSLLIGLVLAITLIAVFVTRDINTFDTDLGFRLIVYALWIGALTASLLVADVTFRGSRKFDERDKLIVERAQKIQLLAVILTLVAWMIGLTEVYEDQGQMPVTFAFIITMSTLIVTNLAQSLGILIGYWRGS